MKVLLIDDDPLVRFALSTMLVDRGYQIVTADNGFQGIKVLREEQPDVVVTDIIMPDREGFETIIEIKRDFPDVGIIAISGGLRQGNLDILPMALALGANAVIAKPFQPNELIAELDKLNVRLHQGGAPGDAHGGNRVRDGVGFVSSKGVTHPAGHAGNVVAFRQVRNDP